MHHVAKLEEGMRRLQGIQEIVEHQRAGRHI